MICPYFGKCGGCRSLDVPYEKQLAEKQFHLVEKIILLEPAIKIENPVSGPQFGYRSRARFRYTKDGIGFFEEKTNNHVVIKYCPVLDELLNDFIAHPPKLNLWELVDGQLSCISTDKKVIFNSDMGWVTVGDRKLPVSGDVFFQSNRILLPELISYIKSNVVGPNVMDLYSGVGTFSAFLEDVFNVTAVEINKKCLSLAKQHLKKTEFFTSPVERWKGRRKNVDTVIVDPPRIGLDRTVPQMISSWHPKCIIYVSVATLKVDTKE